MPEPVRDGNAGCVVHGPRTGRTRSAVLFFATADGHPARGTPRSAPGPCWPHRHRVATPGHDTATSRRDARSSGDRRRRPDGRTTSPAGHPPITPRRPRFSCPTAHRSVTRPRGTGAPSTPQRPAASLRGGPNTPWLTGARERTGAVTGRRLCARRDRIQHTQPMVLSQLHLGAEPFAGWPDTPPPTRQERTARYAFTRRGRATLSKGTSLCASQVKRFVIERFTPRFLIDIELVGEGVTAGPRDAVDSILEIGDWGHVRHRGETCRSDRPVRTRETRTPRGA